MPLGAAARLAPVYASDTSGIPTDTIFFGKWPCERRSRVILEESPAVDYECGGAYLAVCWGVVQPVGHLTVNEDGGGSNPPAPANFLQLVEQ